MFAGITALALRRRRAHGRGPGQPDRARTRRRAEDRAQPDRRWRRSARRVPFYLLQGVHGGDPDPRREHRLQRLPGALLAARPRQLPAAPARQPRRPARVLERDRAARAGRRPADRRLRRRRHPADPALHPRRLPLVHAQPGRDGPPLVARSIASGRRRRARARCGASRRSTALGAVATGARVRDRAGDQVRRRGRGSSSSPRRSCSWR